MSPSIFAAHSFVEGLLVEDGDWSRSGQMIPFFFFSSLFHPRDSILILRFGCLRFLD